MTSPLPLYRAHLAFWGRDTPRRRALSDHFSAMGSLDTDILYKWESRHIIEQDSHACATPVEAVEVVTEQV